MRWGWESVGAGASYAISQYLALLVGLIFFCAQIKWQEVKAVADKIWDTSAFKATLTLNGNIFANNFIILFASVIFNYQSAGFGTIVYTQNALSLQIFALSVYFVEGIGFGTETLAGNFKSKGYSGHLAPLVVVSVVTSLIAGISFGLVSLLFPTTVFGLFTNHTELTQGIGVYLPWLLLVLISGSVGFMLDGYYLGLAEGQIIRNVSIGAIAIGFAPTVFAAWKLESNHILWLAFFIFFAARMVGN
jgi:MATE family multidrug resistance protein